MINKLKVRHFEQQTVSGCGLTLHFWLQSVGQSKTWAKILRW